MGVNDILDYVSKTPENSNRAVLRPMLEALAKEGDTDLQSITITENGTYRSEEGTAWSEVEVEIRGTERPEYTQTFEGNDETVYEYGQSDPDTGFQTIVFTLEHNITELESYNLTVSGGSSTPSKVEILEPNQIKFTEGSGGEYDAWPQVTLEVEYLGETQPIIPDNYLPVFVPTIEGTITDPDQDHPVVTNLSELNALGDVAIFSPSEDDMTASWDFDNYGAGTGAFIIAKANNNWAPVSSGGFYTINATNGEITANM